MDRDGRLAAACARVAREKGWPNEERDRLVALLADDERRRALSDHPRRLEFLARALAEMLGGNGTPGRMVTSAPDEMEVRVVVLMVADGLAPPARRPSVADARRRAEPSGVVRRCLSKGRVGEDDP